MNNSTWWNRIALLVQFLGVVILGFTLALQPKISDDWYLVWNYQDSAGPFNFMVLEYTQWMGRGWGILLATFVLPNPVVEIVYRAFIVIEILLLAALAWYCALGPGAWRRSKENCQALAIFGSLMWLALPARDETVVWLVGNSVYLVSALFALAFIAWIERTLTTSPVDYSQARWRSAALGILSFLVGFGAGVSHEQVVAVCGAYLLLSALRLKCERNLQWRKIGSNVWITALGFVVGVAVLVCAPGNYARMAKIASPSVFEVIERMVLYVPGAFFELGTGTTGKNIWLAGLVFILLHLRVRGVLGEVLEGLKRGGFWWIISLCSLLVMAPATNFISPRTSFFAVIFLFVGFAAMTRRAPSMDVNSRGEPNRAKGLTQMEREWHFALSTAVLMILACLVLVEAVAGLISNAAVAAEFARRIEIVERAKRSTANADFSPIRVPFITTQPAALTYIQSPEHDREFLANWGRRIGRPIVHDVTEGAPLPNSFKPLKAIKYRHRVTEESISSDRQ
jgi:Family of unknown function (DUF6056)